MSELDKLEEYLKANGYEYKRSDKDGVMDDNWYVLILNLILDRHQIVVYHDNGDRAWDAICQEGSYGYEEGLLEIYGDIVWDDIDGDSVRGWLTAQDVINRIERGRDGARMDGEQDGR